MYKGKDQNSIFIKHSKNDKKQTILINANALGKIFIFICYFYKHKFSLKLLVNFKKSNQMFTKQKINMNGFLGDTVFNEIYKQKTFYDLNTLEGLSKYINNCDCALDIGAKIGNNSIFFQNLYQTL